MSHSTKGLPHRARVPSPVMRASVLAAAALVVGTAACATGSGAKPAPAPQGTAETRGDRTVTATGAAARETARTAGAMTASAAREPRVAGPAVDEWRTAPGSSAAATLPTSPVGTDCSSWGPSRFEFRSDFWLNLHNYLYREAKRREGVRDEGVLARGNVRDPAEGAGPATAEDEAVWNRAVDFYREFVVQHRLGQVVRDNDRLATARRADLSDAAIDPRQRRTLLAAAPVYRKVWWPAHRRANAEWIRSMRRLLEATEGCLTSRAARVFRTAWPTEPIPVHATVYASWYGAYTTTRAPRITMSSTAVGNQGRHGLEGLLHEAGHTLLGELEGLLDARTRGTPVNDRELGHLILFYTAGELVREALPEHTPVAEAFGIWEQNRNARRYRKVLEKKWAPYLNGARTLEETVDEVADALDRG